jgi:hypothetical protein
MAAPAGFRGLLATVIAEVHGRPLPSEEEIRRMSPADQSLLKQEQHAILEQFNSQAAEKLAVLRNKLVLVEAQLDEPLPPSPASGQQLSARLAEFRTEFERLKRAGLEIQQH